MKIFLYLLIILIQTNCDRRLKEDIDILDGILQLDRNNYDYAIQKYLKIIVLFKTYDCSICLTYRTSFIELGKMLLEYDIVVAEVIAAENKALSIRMNSQSYPAVYQYNEGVKDEFPTDTDSVQLLFEFALQHAYGLVTELKSIQEMRLFVKRSNIAVVSYSENEDMTEMATKNPQIKFGIAKFSNTLSSQLKVITNKAFDKEIFYNGPFNELQEFLNNNAYPLVFSFTEEEFKRSEQDQVPLIGVITNPSIIDNNLNHFIELAKEYKDQLRFVIINTESELTIKRFQYYVGKFLEFQKIYYYNYYTKYTTSINYHEGSPQIIKQIITDIQIYREPFWEGDGQVHELTPLNFNVQINENPNDILLFNSASPCDICFGFNEIFSQLVKKYEHKLNLVFTKHNYNSKPIKEIKTFQFPSLFLYQKVNGQVKLIIYKGQNTIESISEFIELNYSLKSEQIIEKPRDINDIKNEMIKDNDTQPSGQAITNSGKVVHLTADNFEEIVWQSNFHVFVKFFSPSCQHCQNMALEFELLALLYNGSENIQIAEMDWTRYQQPNIQINGFPTLIMFFKENGKVEQIQYRGQRTAQKMKSFIEDLFVDYHDDL